MKFKVTYTEEIEANTREEAEKQLANKIVGNGTITSRAICPYGKEETSGSCYEMCEYRENLMCDIESQV